MPGREPQPPPPTSAELTAGTGVTPRAFSPADVHSTIDTHGGGGGGGMADLVDDTTPQLGGNLDVNGFTVDGRDPSADGTKLDAIEASATANPRAATTIFEATLSSATHNVNGTTGSASDLTWTATTNNATYITSFTGGDSEVVITSAGEYVVDASMIVLDSATNNRHTILGTLRHLNSGGTSQFEHQLGSMYIRDDAATYDSGAVGGQFTVFLAAGDKLVVRSTVLDTQDSAGNCYPSQSDTVLRVQLVV